MAILERKKATNELVVDKVINDDNFVVASHLDTFPQLFHRDTITIEVQLCSSYMIFDWK